MYNVIILLLLVGGGQQLISAAPSPFTPRFSIGNKQNHHNTLLLQSSNVIRKYYCRPPHDTSLYDVLQIHTNATLTDIQKNWRRLSREYHPDKVAIRRRKRQRNERKQYQPPPPPPPISDEMIAAPPPPPSIDQDEDETERYVKHKLEELTHAYEILSNDDSRLLYHKYGLVGGANEAIQILTGKDVGEVRNSADVEAYARLSELMGYTTTTGVSSNHQNDQSLRLVRTTTERLRPLVEGTISQDLYVADIIRESNLLKKIGLGSQIIRCIGRAYRIEGYRVLRQMHHDKMTGRSGSQHRRHGRKRKSAQHEVADILTDTLREAKHLSQAALSHGRLIMTEQRIKRLEEEAQKTRQQREQRQRFQKIKSRDERIDDKNDDNFVNIGSLSDSNEDIESEYDNINGFYDEEEEEGDESDDQDDLEFDLHHEQNKKIHEALQQAQQIEALWKLHKMELSSTIRRACRLILEPTSSTFCPPPIPHLTYDPSRQPYDGWVGSTGRVVPIDVGRLRAAAALVLLGDILVQSSKEGTSWRKK